MNNMHELMTQEMWLAAASSCFTKLDTGVPLAYPEHETRQMWMSLLFWAMDDADRAEQTLLHTEWWYSDEMTAYRKRLHDFDWNFEFSDDSSRWERANNEKKELMKLQERVDPDKAVWSLYER